MYATVGGWFSKYVAGIRPSEERPGFAEVVIRPHVPSGLAWAEGTLETVRGAVRAAWRRQADGSVEYSVEVPPSATARLELPGSGAAGSSNGRGCIPVEAGRHVVVGRE
jgi:alpha-L-rhamnosidase